MIYLPIRNIIAESKSVAFGCSHTWGVGVEPEETWPYLIGAKNFGVGGCSADYIVRTAPDLIKQNNVKNVFILWPDWTRFDYLKNETYYTSLPTDENRILYMKTYPTEWLIKNFYQQVEKFKTWCNENDIKLIDMTLYDLIPYIDHADVWPVSKLGHHYAPEWHQWVAKIFVDAQRNNFSFPLAHE